jgi:hypothetical protein
VRSFMHTAGILALGVAAFSLAAIDKASAQAASSESVCYKVVEDNDNRAYNQGYYAPERLVLDILFHSRLKTTRNNVQTVYDADGKHTYWEGGAGHDFDDEDFNVAAVFDGSIIVSSQVRKQPRGAHLGGTSYFVRHEDGFGPSDGPYTRPIFWECTSNEARRAPDTWRCTITTGAADYKGVYLKKVKHDRDEKCDIFQDTQRYQPPSDYFE